MGGAEPISHQHKIADGFIWWNIPERGTARNVSGMLRNWERGTAKSNGTECSRITPPITGTGKKTEGFGLDSAPRRKPLDGFSDSPSDGGVSEGQNIEPTEDEIAEKIFSWWCSGVSYSKWYADTYLQQKIDFDFEENAPD